MSELKAVPHPVQTGDEEAIWPRLRKEAEAAMSAEPALTSFVYATITSHDRLEDAVSHRIAQRIGDADVDAVLIASTFRDVLASEPTLVNTISADLAAVLDRDPACVRFLEPLLYFKGFHALATYRFAHALWQQNRNDLALFLQSQASRIFGADIHPGARLGKGIMLDHATGFVVGETAVVGDNCSFLHAVTLGGSGKQSGDRHPKLGAGVLVGAGAKILGNIHVGSCARVAAGSVVLKDVPPQVTVAGIPARIVGHVGNCEPAKTMDQDFETINMENHDPDDYAML